MIFLFIYQIHPLSSARDILFINGTPIIWDGPVSNWIDACDRIIGLEADVVVPGHGPLTDAEGVTAVRDYLSFIEEECKERHAAGQKATEAIAEIDLDLTKNGASGSV